MPSMTGCNPLFSRKILQMEGPEARPFLQNLVPADIRLLEAGKGIWTGILTPQGRVQKVFFLCQDARKAERIYLDCPSEDAGFLLALLKRYRLRAKVSLGLTDLHVSAGSPETQGPENSVIAFYPDPRHPALGWRSITPQPAPKTAETWLTAREAIRLQEGITGDQDIVSGESLALEINMDLLGGVSFTKGCYLGQEVTARMHFRNAVKKRLFPVESDRILTAGDSLTGTESGRVTGKIVEAQGSRGIALLQISAARLGRLAGENGASIRAVWPDWLKPLREETDPQAETP